MVRLISGYSMGHKMSPSFPLGTAHSTSKWWLMPWSWHSLRLSHAGRLHWCCYHSAGLSRWLATHSGAKLSKCRSAWLSVALSCEMLATRHNTSHRPACSSSLFGTVSKGLVASLRCPVGWTCYFFGTTHSNDPQVSWVPQVSLLNLALLLALTSNIQHILTSNDWPAFVARPAPAPSGSLLQKLFTGFAIFVAVQASHITILRKVLVEPSLESCTVHPEYNKLVNIFCIYLKPCTSLETTPRICRISMVSPLS